MLQENQAGASPIDATVVFPSPTAADFRRFRRLRLTSGLPEVFNCFLVSSYPFYPSSPTHLGFVSRRLKLTEPSLF